jgi:hypothetical protein
VGVQLLFEGGPWADRLLDSEISAAPEFVAPDEEQPGVYRRSERHPESPVVVYEWSPDGTLDSRRTFLARLGAQNNMSVRFVLEVFGAAAAFVLAIVTLFWRDWIEVVFRFNADAGDGAVEWAVVFAFAVLSIGLALAARRQWCRIQMAT